MSKTYKLRFLPTFNDDLDKILDYITVTLHNPVAAENLLADIESVVESRCTCADAFEVFRTSNLAKQNYYIIYVKNYMIFYVLIDDVMEVRRILYSHRNWIGSNFL